ncbi:hemerythrin domain-containing protein [Gordonia sp. (in: high G+C Gram-positive bacteria)]|uniref:hemerythrin domain-containing protein n=1 Tax=Gordonia sp. (in: high G+C Gram-positive bacteria) TaxID=84139 RepID=UPI0016A65575|nr:hemerythrin domain-containing protein [Gordonia sp. (in: high G+C Gram-positive bacteria)]NLG46146.1 hemerythrin domain-containing protein [Gordonia sp. (in: high G+C Gram-positive bacteria)]
MSDQATLAEVLTVEHHAIDAGIEKFVAASPGGPIGEWSAPLVQAMAALRRHIYLEEELVFPSLRNGPLMMPIMVMLNEHGEMWRRMAALDEQLAADGVDQEPLRSEVAAACTEMLGLLADHNSKEEPVIYPHLDSDMDDDSRAFLRDFLDDGTTPDGWECARAAA